MSERHPMRLPHRSFPALAAALGLAALAAAGCAKKLTSVDPALAPGAFPEGVRDTLERTPSDLVVWPDTPNLVLDTMHPAGQYLAYRSGAGAALGAIFDYLEATGYQLFRRETGGGYARFQDFVLTPFKRWAERQVYQSPGSLFQAAGTYVLPPAQLFAFADPTPPALSVKGYIGRAVVAGLSSAGYPLTNLGQVTIGASGLDSVRYRGLRSPPDSLVEMRWEAYPGAAGYWVHIYQNRADIRSGDEAIEIGLPAPVAIGKVRDLFIGYFPAPLTSYKLGDPLPTGSRVLVYRVLLGLQAVLVRVSAVDAGGQMIATIRENGDVGAFQERVGEQDRRRTFPLGAVVVTPLRPPPPEFGAKPAGITLEAVDSGVPGLMYYRRAPAPLLRTAR